MPGRKKPAALTAEMERLLKDAAVKRSQCFSNNKAEEKKQQGAPNNRFLSFSKTVFELSTRMLSFAIRWNQPSASLLAGEESKKQLEVQVADSQATTIPAADEEAVANMQRSLAELQALSTPKDKIRAAPSPPARPTLPASVSAETLILGQEVPETIPDTAVDAAAAQQQTPQPLAKSMAKAKAKPRSKPSQRKARKAQKANEAAPEKQVQPTAAAHQASTAPGIQTAPNQGPANESPESQETANPPSNQAPANPADPQQPASKAPANQVTPLSATSPAGSAARSTTSTPPAPSTPASLHRQCTEGTLIDTLNRATTQEKLSDNNNELASADQPAVELNPEDLEKLCPAAKQSEEEKEKAEEEDEEQQQQKKRKRDQAQQAQHARRMRFYRSLQSALNANLIWTIMRITNYIYL